MGFVLGNNQFEILASERLAQLPWERFTHNSIRRCTVLTRRIPTVAVEGSRRGGVNR